MALPSRKSGSDPTRIDAKATRPPSAPPAMPTSIPGRRPTRSMRIERRLAATAVPIVVVVVGSPPADAVPAISAATSVPAVTAAMYPVVPKAEIANRVQSIRRRSAGSRAGSIAPALS